jgi:hypothetical protein
MQRRNGLFAGEDGSTGQRGAAKGAEADAGPLPDEGERTRLTRAAVAMALP